MDIKKYIGKTITLTDESEHEILDVRKEPGGVLLGSSTAKKNRNSRKVASANSRSSVHKGLNGLALFGWMADPPNAVDERPA